MKYIYLSLLFFSLAIVLVFQGQLFSVEDTIELTKTGHRKPVIVFNHRAHAEDYNAKCTDCHHKEQNVKCSNCHKIRDQGKIINIKGAFHQQCHDCHRKTSGPRACGRCHKEVVKK